jgi:predicted RNA-binding protein with PIN domain
MPFIIDGHNLLWSVHNVGADFESISDLQLCRIVSRYLKIIGEKGEMVFDGIGPPDKSGFDNIDNLEVVFSGRDIEADTIIINKIRADTAPKRLTVVSGDRKVRASARTRKALSVKSNVFWKQLQRQLSSKKPQAEPAEKHTGIGEAETSQWLKFFGIDK